MHLCEQTKAIKTQTCRFCLHSYFRARNGRQTVTKYCPLDLFSGDENRLRQAIRSLWGDWVASDATVNNLKIFAAGKYIRPSEVCYHTIHSISYSGLTVQVENILAEGQARNKDMNMIEDIFVESLGRSLLQTKVLRMLSDLQRNLDILDIEGLSELWKEAELATLEQSDAGSTTPLGSKSSHIPISEPGISDWTEFLDTFTSSSRERLARGDPSPKDLHYYLNAHLLSATFKDCSIIVRLDFLRSRDDFERETAPYYPVMVIDLDPKSMNKLGTWEELDREIVAAYSSAERKVCIDANQV